MYCLLITFFYYSFKCPYRELFCSHKRFVVSAGCTGAGTLSQAKIYRAGVALYSERSHCTFASQNLASQHLYRLELNDVVDVGSTSN